MPKIGNIILPEFPLLLAPMEDVSNPTAAGGVLNTIFALRLSPDLEATKLNKQFYNGLTFSNITNFMLLLFYYCC